MQDYYSILGVNKTSNPEEIKKAYRKLAAQHHPDRGGDTQRFQQIQEAYDVLSDPEKRQQYDNPQPEFRFHTGNMGGFDDIFANFGFGGMGRRQQMRRNKNVTIPARMTLKEIFEGKDIVGSIRLPSGKDQALQIKIPRSVQNGDQIRYQGLGDDSIQGLPKGDLIVQIIELPDQRFSRDGPNLYTECNISVFDAVLGVTISVETINNSTLEINVPQGIQSGQMINCREHGLYLSTHKDHRGSMFVKINVITPTNITEADKQILEKLRQKYAS